MRYTLEKACGYYRVFDRKKRLYVAFCRKGVYKWRPEWWVATQYTRKTAEKHLLRLNEKEA